MAEPITIKILSLKGKYSMNYTENDYINAGFKFEKERISAETLRHMIGSEKIDERAQARELIEKGRREARKN
jgi:hypothetical protein